MTIKKFHLAIIVIAVALIAPTTAMALHVTGHTNFFDDVPDGAFYSEAATWAKTNEITTGSPAGSTTFKPLDGVTRGENVTFAKRYDDNIVQPALATLTAGVAANAAAITAKANAADVPATSVASAERTSALTLTDIDKTVVTADISTSGTASLLVSAAVEVSSNGGDNDNMNCNLKVNGTSGLRQSVSHGNNTVVNRAVLTMTQEFPVGAGTHTVIAECNRSAVSSMTVDGASLVILAIG